MTATSLKSRPVERVWGRRKLPEGFPDCGSDVPVGEIWFEDDPNRALLVKYLFTSERLSIQVHPDDQAAKALGLAHGKDEAWLIIDSEPNAVIGLGLKRASSGDELRAAALDGSIEQLVDWRPARKGDAIYSPGGTIHAIGAGLALIEIQQNLDLTYRLYDYGRPRELHVDEAVAVAHPGPLAPGALPFALSPGREILISGNTFIVERWTIEGRRTVGDAGGELLLIPLSAGGRIDGQGVNAGTVWRVDGESDLEDTELLAAYPGAAVRDLFIA